MAVISYLVARLIVAVDENAARILSKGTRQQTESSDPIEPSSAARPRHAPEDGDLATLQSIRAGTQKEHALTPPASCVSEVVVLPVGSTSLTNIDNKANIGVSATHACLFLASKAAKNTLLFLFLAGISWQKRRRMADAKVVEDGATTPPPPRHNSSSSSRGVLQVCVA